MKENGNREELGDGSLYLRLQKKLPEIMLTQYQRWIYEKMGDCKNTSFMATEKQKMGCISLRTVPIIVENGSKSLIINALLDGGCTQTYLNADIAEKLGLHGEMRKSQVNAINGTVVTFETASTEFTLRSMNGQVNTVI